MHEEKTMEFGIRMTREDGVSFFGIEEIQELLKQGAVIRTLEAKGANFQKIGEGKETVSMYFTGGTFSVSLISQQERHGG